MYYYYENCNFHFDIRKHGNKIRPLLFLNLSDDNLIDDDKGK